MELQPLKRSPLEMVILVIVFVSIFAFLFNGYILERRVFRERALLYELSLLRQGVDLYLIMEKKKPSDLIDLAITTYAIPGEKVNQRFVERVNVNDKGQVIDPYGNPYTYDQVHGWVSSSTPGYRNW